MHEARIMYPLPSPLYILVHYQGFTRVDHSTTTRSNFSSSSAILRSRLSRFERFTYDVHSHLRSFLFFLPARMFVSRARNRSGRAPRLYSGGGLQTSALEDFIEGFPKSRRRFWTPPATTTTLVTKRQRSSWDSRATTRRNEEAHPRVSLRGKRYLLGRWWPGENGQEVAGNEDLAGRYTGESLEMSKGPRGREGKRENIDR